MASKSKKRRRVFRASCILAALIIAGSSFAWFTSRDEVTNRLSANADYDVSIVESFAPPKNWLPGQEVNKDVYATNTGTIGAFVREDISGRLSITREYAVPALTADCITLEDDEIYAVEAGSFLAYKPTGSAKKIGDTAVIRPADVANPDDLTTDFKPDATGLYVFRRSIKVAGDTTETFTYDGYYYDAASDKYYKISDLKTDVDYEEYKKTGEDPNYTWAFFNKADNGISTDGALIAASAGFVERKQEVVDPVDLAYTELDTDLPDTDSDYGIKAGKYLVATYDLGNHKNSTALEIAAKTLDQAIHNYSEALELVKAATNDVNTKTGNASSGYTKAEDDLNNASTGAIKKLQDAIEAYDAAVTAYNDAVVDKYNKQKDFDDAEATYNASMTKLYGAPTKSETNADATSLYGKRKASKEAFEAETLAAGYSDVDPAGDLRFLAEFNKWKNEESIADTVTLANLTVAQAEAFMEWLDTDTAATEEHDYYMKEAQYFIDDTNFKNEFKKCFGVDFVDPVAEPANPGTTSTNATATDDSYKGKYDAAKAALGTDADNANTSAWGRYNIAKTALYGTDGTGKTDGAEFDLRKAEQDYKTAYDAYVDALDELNVAKDVLEDANARLERAKEILGTGTIGTADVTDTGAIKAYNDAHDAAKIAQSDGKFKIYIKLSDKAVKQDSEVTGADQWVLHPETSTTTFELRNDKAVFYYTGILEGGETSSKLVDSVILAPSVTEDMFKSFDFDLNVALKSAQIVVDEDEKISAQATPTELDAIATLDDNTTIDTTVHWVDATPVVTTNVDVTVTDAPSGKNLIKMVKTGTGSTATWAVASGSTVEDLNAPAYYAVNGGTTQYRTVTELTAALNAITGDTAPTVTYNAGT